MFDLIKKLCHFSFNLLRTLVDPCVSSVDGVFAIKRKQGNLGQNEYLITYHFHVPKRTIE